MKGNRGRQYKYIYGFTAVSKVILFKGKSVSAEGKSWQILSLIIVILSLKKIRKSLILKEGGKKGSTEL